MDMLKGKVAVVTGGTRGIGYSIVETFLRNGATVVLLGSRQETVDKALASLKEADPAWPVEGFAPKLDDYNAMRELFAQLHEKYGRIDILVNNAGVSARESLYTYDPTDFDRVMDLNVNSVFYRGPHHEGTGRRCDPEHQLHGQPVWPGRRRCLPHQ